MANNGYNGIVSALADRIREAARELGSLNQLAEVTGIPRRTLGNWLKGTQPKPDALERIAQKTGVSLEWLVSGDGGKYENALDRAMRILDHQRQQEHARSRLEQEELEVALGHGLALLGEQRPLSSKQTLLAELGYSAIPRLEVRASAGSGRLAIVDDEEAQMVAFRQDWLRRLGISPKHAAIIVAEGDSMEPTIGHGDLVLIDKSIDRIVDEGIYVLVLAGLVLLKRIQVLPSHSILLKSDNPAYDTLEIRPGEAPELIIEGRVRWAGGQI